ncbi:PP2C family serine/threonine-protein phosphatase [Candidatus Marithrix sp. Canyon 246]|uniref:PP2C family serine/threonine-protein phosphatase n=1 Tax=Candidatus Marithrix sp. Canyon 246 TaxID=1827136 RepID=UPI000849F77A|nr:PP2C family serine/threonine-protein phosphatase [Candidatus Marithrix sp. Canyon 246]
MSLQQTELGWVLANKRRGASHRKNHTACQDAYAVASTRIDDKQCLAIAVADGHGSKDHDLSQYGAEYAVEIAIKELLAFFKNFYAQEKSLTLLKKNFKDNFPRRLGLHWRNAILKDALNRRLSLPIALTQQNDTYMIKRYGTTLLVALVLPDILLMGKIGDGDILRFTAENQIENLFNENNELIANYTYSLSSPGADKLWEIVILTRNKGEALILATDGLSNAFIDEVQFHAFCSSTFRRIQEFGMKSVESVLPQWLDDYSSQATGDDITLVMFTDYFQLS